MTPEEIIKKIENSPHEEFNLEEFKNKEYDSLSAQKIFESWVNSKNE